MRQEVKALETAWADLRQDLEETGQLIKTYTIKSHVEREAWELSFAGQVSTGQEEFEEHQANIQNFKATCEAREDVHPWMYADLLKGLSSKLASNKNMTVNGVHGEGPDEATRAEQLNKTLSIWRSIVTSLRGTKEAPGDLVESRDEAFLATGDIFRQEVSVWIK